MSKYLCVFVFLVLVISLAGCSTTLAKKVQDHAKVAAGGGQVAGSVTKGASETTVKPQVRSTERAVYPGPAAPVVWAVPIKQRAVFITIDDGWYPRQKVLAMMKRLHLPLTAFLIQEAAAEHVSYWKEFVKLGGSIEDHTYSHPFLTRVSAEEDFRQIASPIQYFRQLGANPDELRPPYGDWDLLVQKIAAKAGIKQVVMWDAVMAGGKLTTYNGGPLVPGEIVLLHWLPGLGYNLEVLLGILKQEGLGVASLSDALNGRPVRVVFPESRKSTETSVYGNVYGSSTAGSVVKVEGRFLGRIVTIVK